MASKKSKNDNPIQVDEIVGEIKDIEIDPDYPVFTSGIVCDLINVNPWFLKQLDDEGLVSPQRENENSTRCYSKNELNKVAYISNLMNEKNLNIEGVKLVLQLQNQI